MSDQNKGICQSCSVNPAVEERICPLADNEETTCNCCSDCFTACSDQEIEELVDWAYQNNPKS